jgi:putative ABC transport system ATP-binding protein
MKDINMSIVTVTDVHREYQQGEHTVRALQGVSLEIEKGEFTVLMGPSGSGKTTLLNIIGGLDSPSKGGVSIDGSELSSLSAGELSDLRLNKLGFVFQAYNLIPVLSAYENIEFVPLMQGVEPQERKDRCMAMLKSVGLEGMENRKPSELSGGQQQRVAVARAIAGNPVLVLADEPTANLDSKTGNALIELMKKLNEEKGVTFVFATHDPKVMAAAKRVVSLEDGLIIIDENR